MKRNSRFVFYCMLLTVVVFVFKTTYAQLPQGFNMQMILRDSDGATLPNTQVYLQFSILQDSVNGIPVYQETHDKTSNDFGLINTVLGQGTVIFGDFSAILWQNRDFYIRQELDMLDGNGLLEMGTSQFMSIPYAMTAGNILLEGPDGTSYHLEIDENGELASVPHVLPVAGFFGDNDYGVAPFEVSFTDTSLNTVTTWNWDFGNGEISSTQNPNYTFSNAGKYTISLTVGNEYGSDTEVKHEYIEVIAPATYSCEDSVVDIDGNVYNTVVIGSQCWMKENLIVTHYPNGDEIPFVSGYLEWKDLLDNNTDDGYCYYDNNSNNDYGPLYTYAAAIGDNWLRDNAEGQGICPEEWHLATLLDWDELIYYIGGRGVAGAKMKETGTAHWRSPNTGATNETGFTGLPGGRRNSIASFYEKTKSGIWWAATEYSDVEANTSEIYYNRSYLGQGARDKSTGLSVRCIKNRPFDVVPEAGFSATPSSGHMPLSVTFTDETLNTPTSWSWDFGDGTTSTLQNPSHTYSVEGKYTVSLSVSNPYGTDALTIVDYIDVDGPDNNCPDSIADYDGNYYQVESIGYQCWMKENLKVTHYPNGTEIPQTSSEVQWNALDDSNTDDAYCIYENSPSSDFDYLYTYAAAIADNWQNDNSDGQGICPDGWHLPVEADWDALVGYVGSTSTGGKLKDTTYWNTPNIGATNESGFAGYPGGDRYSDGTFANGGDLGFWWTAQEEGTANAWNRYLSKMDDLFLSAHQKKSYGYSVRCIRTDSTSNLPVADFTASPSTGQIPLVVIFSDISTNSPASWSWDFGDGNTSTDQHPSHTYSTIGVYTVSLTISNASGTDTETKVDYINVTTPLASCPESLTDIDGNAYNTVEIGPWCWMKENLYVKHYPNGEGIPYYYTSELWKNLGDNNVDDAFSAGVYGLDTTSCGYFYSYAAAIADDWQKDNIDGQGVCPDGWHLPNRTEWTELSRYLDGNLVAGGKIKQEGTAYWDSPNTGATNETGFSVRGSGYRYYNDGEIKYYRKNSYIWSATETDTSDASSQHLSYHSENFYLGSHSHKSNGYNVRCLKNMGLSNYPDADFTANEVMGQAPFTVDFTDLSTNTPTCWNWDFGDGNTDFTQNPIHTYDTIGIYTVKLTVSNVLGVDSITKSGYIEVVGEPCAGIVTDIDGNEYNMVHIGGLCWMDEDLQVTHYPNGDDIPHITDNDEWAALENNSTDDAYCYYDNNPNTDYGCLYTYAAAIGDDWERDNVDGQGICPDGWHLATDEDWTELQTYLGGTDVAGGKLKEQGTTHWWAPNTGATNESGFTALPGGLRNDWTGVFNNSGTHGIWHTASGTYPCLQSLYALFSYHYGEKSNGFSVRCVRDY